MADPRTAFTENPWTDCAVELDYRGIVADARRRAGERRRLTDRRSDPGAGFARGHYEQHVGGAGVIRVGDEEWAVDGFGLRDHSWGPRFWQAPVVVPLAHRQLR